MVLNRFRAWFRHPAADPMATITQAADGLLFSSESDYPLAPFAWTGDAPLSPQGLCKLAGLPEDTPVTQVAVDAFFAPALRVREGATPEARARVARFQKLLQVLHENLESITVYRLGRVEMPVFIVGRLANGGIAGLRTTLVES